jgi:hypothetical protein
MRKININWLNGVLCALLRTRVGLVFMTLRSKIQPYWGSGCLSYLLFKLLTEEGTWQTILEKKYIGQKALSQVL